MQDPFSLQLNLAGVQGVPTPNELARPLAQTKGNPPTFSAPDMSLPPLATYDLSIPGIDVRPAFAADPALPDLKEYDQPDGLDIYPTNLLPSIEPQVGDLFLYKRPNGLDVTHDILEPDPLLPDLQQPDLTQQVSMQERPGDLAASALQVMHLDQTYQQLDSKTYPAVFMDQSAMNDTRSRHMDLLMRGIDLEER